MFAMDAATNTGYTLACGYSFEQGSAELRQASLWIQQTLFQLVSPFSHKLIFILIPRCIRRWIPLRYWPGKITLEYQEVHQVTTYCKLNRFVSPAGTFLG